MLHIIPNLKNEREFIESDAFYFVWDSDDFSLELISGQDLLVAIEKISGFNNIAYLGGRPYILSDTGAKSVNDLWNESRKVLSKRYTIYECDNKSIIFVLKNSQLYRVTKGKNRCVLPVIKNKKLKFISGYIDSNEFISLSIEYIGTMSKDVFRRLVILDLDKLCNKERVRSVGGI